jgi:ribonuclease I
MSLRQKGTYAPPQDKARGLNIHDGLWPHMINKIAIQPQIKHNQATKTCQDHIKAFTHERAHM